jgi:hypothetical protein
MVVKSIREIFEDKAATVDEAGRVARKQVFRLDVDTPMTRDEAKAAFMNATGIRRYRPWVGPDGVKDETCRVADVSAEQVGGAKAFLVTVSYAPSDRPQSMRNP